MLRKQNNPAKEDEEMKKIWNSLAKDFWVVLLDIIAVNLSFFLALIIRFYVNFALRPVAINRYMPALIGFAPWYTVLCLIVFTCFKLYGGMWRYAGINDMNRIVLANVTTGLLYITGTMLLFTRMPITYYLIGMVLQLGFTIFIRFAYRIAKVEKKRLKARNTNRSNCIVVGTGESGRRVVKHLEEGEIYRPVAVVGSGSGAMDGVPIMDSSELQSLIEKKRIEYIIISDPLLPQTQREEIRKLARKNKIEIADYTGFYSNLGGKLSVTELLSLTKGPVIIDIGGKEKSYDSGETVLADLTQKYNVKEIRGQIKIKLEEQRKISTADALAQAYAAVIGEEHPMPNQIETGEGKGVQ